MKWDDSKDVKYAYYAVAERDKPEDFRWLTVFAVVDHMTCSLPTSREGLMDTLHYVFKSLTKAEFDTHIAFDSLENRDSDTFSIAIDDVGIQEIHNRYDQRVRDEDVLDKQKP